MVTAYGAWTSLGSAQESWHRICNGEIGIKLIPQWQNTVPGIKLAGLVEELPPLENINPNLAVWAKKEKLERRCDRSVQIAFLALADMLSSFPGVFSEIPSGNMFGVVCGPSLGGQQSNEEGYQLFLNQKHGRHQLTRVLKVMPDAFSGWASIFFGATGYSSCCVTACATGLSNILLAAEKIQSGKTNIMLAGGFEGNTDYFVDAFAGAGALSKNPNPAFASRPFDLNRDGFVIGDGAAVVILEELNHALSRGITPLAAIAGWSEQCDANHMTNGSYQIQAQTITKTIKNAQIKPSEIDLVSVHATSTILGDHCEAQALSEVFSGNPIDIMATKANLGHTLGGAGAIELVQCIQAIRSSIIPTVPTVTEHDPSCHPDTLRLPSQTIQKQIKTVLTQNFGFGGKNAAAIVNSYKAA